MRQPLMTTTDDTCQVYSECTAQGDACQGSHSTYLLLTSARDTRPTAGKSAAARLNSSILGSSTAFLVGNRVYLGAISCMNNVARAGHP